MADTPQEPQYVHRPKGPPYKYGVTNGIPGYAMPAPGFEAIVIENSTREIVSHFKSFNLAMAVRDRLEDNPITDAERTAF